MSETEKRGDLALPEQLNPKEGPGHPRVTVDLLLWREACGLSALVSLIFSGCVSQWPWLVSGGDAGGCGRVP